ncbi:MAG: lysophospholipid acyltransferase family protein [Proteobacteria bacterium]|nr:DUF374 domain-containing protein [Desulfobulbaceae bacterium]MBU4153364.1 lysophospholipid acyltransferase family protein [Pseudomonadota bacterium]
MAVKGFVHHVSLAVVPPLYIGLSRMLFATCREQHQGIEHYHSLLASGKPFIACFWHYSILYAIKMIEGRDWVAMVSASDDAEYLSRTLTMLGHHTVRGSRNRGGLVALKEMLAVIKRQGRRAAIVGDGSQGPPLVLQPGVILMASKAGVPILPFAWGVDRFWTFRSWDRTVLPKPFARVAMCFDEPVTVPPAMTGQEIEHWRQEVEGRMLTLYTRAWRSFGRKGHMEIEQENS